MTPREIKDLYDVEWPKLKAMGEYVSVTLAGRLGRRSAQFGELVKIPANPRVKDLNSLAEKIIRKNLTYEQVTDRVGVRYVVLLDSDVQTICQEIEAETSWTFSRDRDYEVEREQNPSVFGYQSVHYVVRLCQSVVVREVEIEADTPCEIQVRTLLQHAVAELTHDAVYKAPRAVADPAVHRTIAKSTALAEATGDFFTHAATALITVKNELSNYNEILTSAFGDLDPSIYTEGLNSFMIDVLRGLTDSFSEESLRDFLNAKPFVLERVKDHQDQSHLFGQPAILLLYYIVNEFEYMVFEKIPFPDVDVAPVYTDLGITRDPRW